MTNLDLLFHGKAYPVPKKSLSQFVANHDLFAAKSYAVQSSVPRHVFEHFVDSLSAQAKADVTTDNAVFLSLIANEFSLPDLSSACAAFSVSVSHFSSLSGRVSKLERSISNGLHQVEATIESQERELENLRFEVEGLKRSLSPRVPSVQQQTPKPVPASPANEPAPKPSAVPKPASGVDLPLRKRNSLEGVIWYLTKKHGGNVSEKGIVAITSKSVHSSDDWCALKNLADFADLSSNSAFLSADAPGQWVCWDFRGMIVRPTHYTIRGPFLTSWVFEGSLDGSTWSEIDRQTGKADFGRKDDGPAQMMIPTGIPPHSQLSTRRNAVSFGWCRRTREATGNIHCVCPL
jgi:hypothetical protein